MAVKFHCRKCGKRFIDWGAEKLGFKCPDCGDEELVRLGAADEKAARKPSLKRKPRRVVSAAAPDDGILGGDIDEMDAEETEVEATDSIFLDTEDDDARAGVDLDEVLPADELAEAEAPDLEVADELGFDAGASIEGDPIDEPVADADEWTA